MPTSSRNKSRAQGKRTIGPILALSLLAGALLLAVFGILQLRDKSVGTGMIVLIAALALIAVTFSRIGALTFSKQDTAEVVLTWLPMALVVLAVFFCGLSVYEVAQPRSTETGRLAAIFWALGILTLIIGVLRLDRWQANALKWADWIRSNRWELAALAALFVAAVVLRFYALEQYPTPWSGDEASVDIGAREALHREGIDLFNAGWGGQPNFSFYPAAISMSLLGESIFAGRVVSAIIGALTILTAYVLGRELFGRTVATMATTFLAAFPYHLQFSRIGVTVVFDALNVTLALWLVIRAVRTERLATFMWAGLVAGFAPYTFVGSRLVTALSAGLLIYLVLRRPGYWRRNDRRLGAYAVAMVVMLGPLAYFFAAHPDVFMDRLGQVGIVFNGWLGREAAARSTSAAAVLLDQFARTGLVYVARGFRTGFYSSPEPYLGVVGAVLFLLGMGHSWHSVKREEHSVLMIWFWAVFFLGGVLTVDPPAQTRLFMTAPAVALLLAIGIEQLLIVLGFMGTSRRWQAYAAAGAVGLLVIQNVAFYYGWLRSSHYAQDPNAEVAMVAGQELQGLGEHYTLVMLGQPRMVSGFPTIPFLAPQNLRVDVASSDAAALDLSGKLPSFMVATPDNLAGLRALAQRYPGGTWESVGRMGVNEVLYFSYTVDATSGP